MILLVASGALPATSGALLPTTSPFRARFEAISCLQIHFSFTVYLKFLFSFSNCLLVRNVAFVNQNFAFIGDDLTIKDSYPHII